MSDRYTPAQARKLAEVITVRLGVLAAIACAGSHVRPAWLLGLVGMEDPQLREWPDKRSTRFEPGVYAKLKALANPLKFWRRSWNGITIADVKGLDDATLRALATSYGWTQIMGYYVLTIFKGHTLAQLRDPASHFTFAVQMLEHDCLVYLKRQQFDQVCHIWNTGAPYKIVGGRPVIKTYSPSYIPNCALVAQFCQEFLAHEKIPAGTIVQGQSGPTSLVAQETPALEANSAPTVKGGALFVTDKLLRPIGQTSTGQSVEPLTPLGESQQQAPGSPPPPPAELDPSGPSKGTTMQENPVTRTTLGLGEQSPSDEVQVQPPDAPKIDVKPGWQTSEAHMTVVFGLVAAALSFLGFHYTPEKINNAYEAIMGIVKTIGPIGTFIPILFNYITSRGKAKSNAVWATASLANPLVKNDHLMQQGFDIGSILGGKDWKDPARYIDIAKLAGQAVPGGGVITNILDKVGVGGGPAATAPPSGHTLADADITAGFQQVAERLHEIANILQANHLTNPPTLQPASQPAPQPAPQAQTPQG